MFRSCCLASLLFLSWPVLGHASTTHWMVQLEAPPAAVVWAEAQARTPGSAGAAAAAKRAAQSHLQSLEGAQESVLSLMGSESIDARLLYRLQRVLNGFVVLAEPRQADRIAALPGVRSVRPMVPKHTTNSSSLPFLGVPSVWEAMGFDATGAGVEIGIIDTGIDYLHNTFGGSGLIADYAASDPTTLADGFFPTVKVAGGLDFVGDDYNASDPAHMVPVPDPDPMDCRGHGSHVAGTVAGLGTNLDGSTYAGAYDNTLPFASMGIGPGMAPGATLYALKVFGCSGTTAVVEQALEWAVDPNGDGDFSDRLDVVNLSLTDAVGTPDDPASEAADNAVLAGVVLVASAGNDGGQHFIAGSPGTADRVVSVAASWDPDDTFTARAVRVDSPGEIAGTFQAGGANFGPNVLTPLSGEAVLANPIEACTPLANPAVEIDGKIVLIDRSTDCTFVTQVRNAQEAGTTGAIAVVFVNDRPGLEGIFDDGTGGDITIPPLLLREDQGQAIKDQLPGVVDLTLTPILLEDMFAIFSSRGPRPDPERLVLKPDVTAPGVAIRSATVGDTVSGGVRRIVFSGTSQATAHASGAMALLRELHPDWTPAELKALLMNTAKDVYFNPESTPPVLSPAVAGAGRMQPLAAAGTQVIAMDEDEEALVSVSYGNVEAVADGTLDRDVRFVNQGLTDATYDLSIRTLGDVPGAEVILPDGSEVTVPAGGTASVRLQLTLDYSELRHTRAPGVEQESLGFLRNWLSEESGLLVAVPTAGDETEDLRVPFYAAVRPASSMAAGLSFIDVAGNTSGLAVLPLLGEGVGTGSDPTDILSLATALELQLVGFGEDEPAFVGVTSDFQPEVEDSMVYFGVVAQEPWATPHQVSIEVLIDVDQDGTADFLLRNGDQGTQTFGFITDAFVSVLQDLTTEVETVEGSINIITPEERDSNPFLNTSMVLVASAQSLGLEEGAGAFDYTVQIRENTGPGGITSPPVPPTPESLVPTSPTAAGSAFFGRTRRATGRLGGGAPPLEGTVLGYDLENPGLQFTGAFLGPPIFPDLNGSTIPVTYDLTAFDSNGSLGILLIHHHNPIGQQAEVIPFSGDLPDLELTLVASPEPAIVEEMLTYTLGITNVGPQAAADSTIELQLPADTVFEAGASDPACSESSGLVTCTLGSVAASEIRNLNVVVTLEPAILAFTTLEASAQAATSDIDPNLANNLAQVVSEVRPTGWIFGDDFESGDLSAWSLCEGVCPP